MVLGTPIDVIELIALHSDCLIPVFIFENTFGLRFELDVSLLSEYNWFIKLIRLSIKFISFSLCSVNICCWFPLVFVLFLFICNSRIFIFEIFELMFKYNPFCHMIVHQIKSSLGGNKLTIYRVNIQIKHPISLMMEVLKSNLVKYDIWISNIKLIK